MEKKVTRVFYVDDRGGEDQNSGFSEKTAWKSLDRVNQTTFHPGDVIRFRRGGHWKGMLEPKGSGCRFLSVTIEAYGEGDKPEIDGDGAYAGILLFGVSFWKVDGMKVANRAEERSVRQGICICGKSEGITEGIEICNCEVLEVVGQNCRARDVYQSMYWNGGIYITMTGRSSEKNHLHDIIIFNNVIHDVYTSGIRVNQQEDFINDIHHTHIVIRGNRIERTGSDGIIVANCISPLIDRNICYDAGALGNLQETMLIAGIWVCATSNALIQRNEVARTRMFQDDGTAFDTDWGTAGDTIFQYNYSHDNEGGFWLDCTKFNHNRECGTSILRYNVSIRDGRGIGVYNKGLPVEFYGNLFAYDKPAEICCHDEGENYLFSSNIFLFKEQPKNGWKHAKYLSNWYGTLENLPEDPFPLSLEAFDGYPYLEPAVDGMDWLKDKWDSLCSVVKTKGQLG